MHRPPPSRTPRPPHGWGLKGGDTYTGTCHGRRRAPQVHGNCIIRRQRFNEAAGRASLAYDELTAAVHTNAVRTVTTPSCVQHARVHPSMLPGQPRGAAAGTLARPSGA
jgi:hypothetical protein